MAARQRQVHGQAGALAGDRLLDDLDQDRLAFLEAAGDRRGLVDPASPIADGSENVAGGEKAGAAGAEGDENRLHAGRQSLDPTEVDLTQQIGLVQTPDL